MSTGAQIKKIHVLKDDLHLDDDHYHALLATYHRLDDGPVESSKDLSVPQASEVIKTLEHVVDETPELRFRIYASDRQVKMLFALWHTITGLHDESGVRKTLLTFLEHHFHVHDFEHIPKKKASKIIYALSIMSRQKAKNDDHLPATTTYGTRRVLGQR